MGNAAPSSSAPSARTNKGSNKKLNLENPLWIPDFDEHRERPYWYNPTTCQTTFARPSPHKRCKLRGLLSDGKVSSDQRQIPKDWKAAQDTASGQVFYYHPPTQLAVWNFGTLMVQLKDCNNNNNNDNNLITTVSMECTPLETLESIKNRIPYEWDEEDKMLLLPLDRHLTLIAMAVATGNEYQYQRRISRTQERDPRVLKELIYSGTILRIQYKNDRAKTSEEDSSEAPPPPQENIDLSLEQLPPASMDQPWTTEIPPKVNASANSSGSEDCTLNPQQQQQRDQQQLQGSFSSLPPPLPTSDESCNRDFQPIYVMLPLPFTTNKSDGTSAAVQRRTTMAPPSVPVGRRLPPRQPSLRPHPPPPPPLAGTTTTSHRRASPRLSM